MEQTDFFKKFEKLEDGDPKPDPTFQISKNQTRLQFLLDQKKRLEDRIFACNYCNKSSLGGCDHDSEMSNLLKEIEEVEISIAKE